MKRMKMSNKTYDFLNQMAKLWIPMVGTCYFALAEFWNLPKVVEVVGTLTVVDTALGMILEYFKSKYNKEV